MKNLESDGFQLRSDAKEFSYRRLSSGPMLSIVAETFAAQGPGGPASDGVATKFIPIDLSRYFKHFGCRFPPAVHERPGLRVWSRR